MTMDVNFPPFTKDVCKKACIFIESKWVKSRVSQRHPCVGCNLACMSIDIKKYSLLAELQARMSRSWIF